MGVNYKLVVVTHGRNVTLTRSLDSFFEHVYPLPATIYLHGDGEAGQEAAWNYSVNHGRRRAPGVSWVQGGTSEVQGFCSSCRAAWNEEAAIGEHEHVFWLEHDFTFERALDLEPLAEVLAARPQLAQMALMRDAVNALEREAGGLYESRLGQYEPRWGTARATCAIGDPDWLEHHSYLTTNPSLMRREWMAEHPWPEHPAECEGRFGIDLVLAGASFGVWGAGEPWVRHIGTRTGTGY